jgi:sugar/nucleoside kinase (ribokinase family)
MSLGVFFGLTGLDSIYYVDNTPEENHKIKTHDYKTYIGGPAANAAITFSLLGGKAILITYIGSSHIAISIKEELVNMYGIIVHDLSQGDSAPPPLSSIIINKKNASRTVYSGQPNKLLIKKIIEQEELYADANFFFTDSNLPELTIPILKNIQKYHKPVVLDLGSWKKNSLEAVSLSSEVIASNNCRYTESNEDFFTIKENFNSSLVAITNGENNIIFSENKNINYISPPKVIARDTLAAGDVFHGAYCFCRFDLNYDFKTSLKHASYIAAESVKFNGPREGVIKYANVNLNKYLSTLN